MALRQEESKIQHDLSGELSKILVDVQALEIDFDVLIGGVLEVISQSKTDADKSETWRESGQKFLKSRNRRGQEKECVISDPHRPDQNCLEIRYKISPGCDNFEPTRQPIHPALS